MSEQGVNSKETVSENDETWHKRLLLLVMTMVIAMLSI